MRENGQKIPVTITGFLGSGKTTLIRHLLPAQQGRRIVLVNEFGNWALMVNYLLLSNLPRRFR